MRRAAREYTSPSAATKTLQQLKTSGNHTGDFLKLWSSYDHNRFRSNRLHSQLRESLGPRKQMRAGVVYQEYGTNE